MTSRPNPKAFMYLALGTVVIGGGLCYFQYTKFGEVQSRLVKLRGEVSDPKAVQSRLDASNMQLEGARQSLIHLEANVSSAAYVPSLLHDLDGYGKQNGIAVTGVRPAPKSTSAADAKAKASKPYDELNIQITGTGSFDSIQKFVSNLPTFPKIVAARMVTIEPSRGAGPDAKQGVLNMTVQIKAYVFKADEAIDGTAPTAQGTPASAALPGATAPTKAISGASAPATSGALPASQVGPAKGAPVKSGGTAPTVPPATLPTPAAKQSAPGKTAFGKARRVRVEG
jgi:Tfp pilus assembly protein PilO